MTFSFTGWDMLMWTGKKRKEKGGGGDLWHGAYPDV